MGRRGRYHPPVEVEIEALGKKGVGIGEVERGPMVVRGAPPGSRVLAVPFKRKRGVWHARRAALVRPPEGYERPRCAVFGLCGGCVLQELALDAQRSAKHDMAVRAVRDGGGPRDALEGVVVHPVLGTASAYGYRNKVELSFGTRRFLSEADHAAGVSHEGRFLGFHAPGRFDRVVDAQRCELVSEAANAIVDTARRIVLTAEPPPYDAKARTGGWRHLVIREGTATGQLLVAVHTTSEVPEVAMESLADALLALRVEPARVVGVVWVIWDGLADIAGGETRRVWGRDQFEESLGGLTFELSRTSFFQTSTHGAEELYRVIGRALGEVETLVDLYCGVGSIGLYLRDQCTRIVGVELSEAAVVDARRSAVSNGVSHAEYRAGPVRENLEAVACTSADGIVVDPPRAGLHPKVARYVAQVEAGVLVYVACSPASLGRDVPVLSEGGWRMTDLWTVDLFPQTGHIEAVARFVR